jgi:DNA repair ATPase RecN
MALKKAITTGSVLGTLDTNQWDEDLLREARNQKMKLSISLEPQDQALNQEINNLEGIHQQLEKRREKVLRLYELQKKIDEATKQMHNIEAQDQNNYRDQNYKDFNQENLRHALVNFQDFLYDEASPLTPELQVTPGPPLYRPLHCQCMMD